MAHQVLRYHPTDQGEHVPGWPMGPLTDEDVAAKAQAEDRTVQAVMAEAVAYKRADGKPLWTVVGKADEADEVPVPKVKVPLGEKPAG